MSAPSVSDSQAAFALLRRLFDAAVEAAQPHKVMDEFLPEPAPGRTVVVGAGKASAAMAKAFEAAWRKAGREKLEGLVVTQYGYGETCDDIEIVEAGHPVPDENGMSAARRIKAQAESLGPDDQMVALISGGGSALLCLPAGDLTLADKQRLNELLLASGASIDEMNCVRKHFSAIKGGQLALASRARVHSLILSDIPGDILHLVASGPTIPDPSGVIDAKEIIRRYKINLPPRLANWLDDSCASAPLPNDKSLPGGTVKLLASAQSSLEAAAERARHEGYDAHILSDRIEGEARDAGRVHAAVALQIKGRNQPFPKPCLLLSGGETTVTVRAKGKGGRNTEFLLAFAVDIAGHDGIFALAADTDGRDGTENNAGAVCNGQTVGLLRAKGLDPRALLAANNAWAAFQLTGGIVETGPTRTNVNDFRAILIT